MPKYQVDGADAESGIERSIVVEAPNAPRAREAANAQGILVTTAHRVAEEPADAVQSGAKGSVPRARRASPKLLEMTKRDLESAVFRGVIQAVLAIFGCTFMAAIGYAFIELGGNIGARGGPEEDAQGHILMAIGAAIFLLAFAVLFLAQRFRR